MVAAAETGGEGGTAADSLKALTATTGEGGAGADTLDKVVEMSSFKPEIQTIAAGGLEAALSAVDDRLGRAMVERCRLSLG